MSYLTSPVPIKQMVSARAARELIRTASATNQKQNRCSKTSEKTTSALLDRFEILFSIVFLLFWKIKMNSFVFVAASGVCALLFGLVSSSAIPMWEFLSKDEKMSFLYSMFANQVEEYCDSSSVKDCSQELLKYGLKKLKDMPEDYLDKMDPYQRGASNIIWDSMVEGHEMMKTKSQRRSTTTAKPNSYDDQSFGDDFGSRSEASAKIETVIFKILPPKELTIHQYGGGPSPTAQYFGSSEYTREVLRPQTSNRIQERTTEKNIPIIESYGDYERAPLTGPMVVRVHLDGTPVEDDDNASVPQDEDLRLYKLSKTRLPNL